MIVGGYLRDIFWLCNVSTMENAFLKLTFNKTEKDSFLNSIGMLSRMRLDTLVTLYECTFLVGEEKST